MPPAGQLAEWQEHHEFWGDSEADKTHFFFKRRKTREHYRSFYPPWISQTETHVWSGCSRACSGSRDGTVLQAPVSSVLSWPPWEKPMKEPPLERWSAWVLVPLRWFNLGEDTVPTRDTLKNKYPSHTRPISFLFHHQFCSREHRRAQVWVSPSSPGSADNLSDEKGHMQCSQWL